MRKASERLVYVVAGEASGDAIGSKLIRSLKKNSAGNVTSYQFRGVGGAQMMKDGEFISLFPMNKLSFMGIAEVIPRLWSTVDLLRNVAKDIEACKPDAVITIDSKGFNFRLHQLLNRQGFLYHVLRVFGQVGSGSLRDNTALIHYVAPSSWAYKHKFKKIDATAASLAKLFDHMLVILPFEEPLFQPKALPRKCVSFVGHPALEDFYERHNLFNQNVVETVGFASWHKLYNSIPSEPSPWYTDKISVELKAFTIHQILQSRHFTPTSLQCFTICALVGSRENEVHQTINLVKKAISKLVRDANLKPQVVFPTISALAPLISSQLADWDVPYKIEVEDDTRSKYNIYQACDLAIAVSGTVVLETTLSGLPTLVIYRANRLTEWLAKRLARVSHVSLPNIMSSKDLIPELLFSDCTSDNIYSAILQLQRERISKANHEITPEDVELCHNLSSLIRWNNKTLTPLKASAEAAQVVIAEMDKKHSSRT